jgi:UDP-GlcNAc:undecaprenyl-phosphate/decaprenyl-phosphate GlcNAc-1-phosphate transferase
MMVLGLAGVVAGIASLLITPMLIRMAIRFRLTDSPGGRRIHSQPVPRLGGVAVFLALLIAMTAVMGFEDVAGRLTVQEARFFVGLLLGGGLLLGLGIFDDLRGAGPVVKLAVQCTAALLVVHLGVRVEVLSLGGDLDLRLGWLAVPVTVFWVVGVTNAFNLIDGLDGLATGIALVALATTTAMAVAMGRWEVALVSTALFGALLGFLYFNFNPARIFLGDSGSMFVGFMLGVLSVSGSMKSATAVLVIVPLFALALPILDTSLSMVRRWLRGVPISRADARHIHHQLLALGLTQRSVALAMYALAVCLAAVGLTIAFSPPALLAWISAAGGALCLGMILVGMRSLRYHEFFEAGGALVSAARKWRSVIRDRIHARDVATLIAGAGSLEEIQAILTDAAPDFRFAHLEVCEDLAPEPPFLRVAAEARRVWNLEYPLHTAAEFHPVRRVLRVWCWVERGSRPYGAERVASILAPAINGWITGRGIRSEPITPIFRPERPALSSAVGGQARQQ